MDRPADPPKELKLNGFVSERSRILNPIFVDGYADNWHFAVPEAFKDALDIKWTAISRDKVITQALTQGSNYSFKEGDLLYDNRHAYEKPWGEAIASMKFCVKVIGATPATVVVSKEIETSQPVVYIEDKTIQEAPRMIRYERTRMEWGHVRFEVYKPSATEKKVELIEVKETTQELFVYYLQTGEFMRP
jgi:hypothetical protein